MTGEHLQTHRDRNPPERTTTMHVPTASHRPARHTRYLPSSTGGLDDAHQFWPVRRLADWTSGDHHRHSKTRTPPRPPALLGPGTEA
jgi:hypothetical protein